METYRAQQQLVALPHGLSASQTLPSRIVRLCVPVFSCLELYHNIRPLIENKKRVRKASVDVSRDDRYTIYVFEGACHFWRLELPEAPQIRTVFFGYVFNAHCKQNPTSYDYFMRRVLAKRKLLKVVTIQNSVQQCVPPAYISSNIRK